MHGWIKQFIWVLVFCLPVALAAQKDRKKELELEKVRLQDEIELANKILEETRSSKESTLGNIETVEQKIRLRENLLKTLNRETEILTDEINHLETEIDTLEAQVARLKEDYARMIRQAYKSRSTYSRLMFILSSEDFNQALRRLEYLQQYSEYRRRQVEEIQKKENDLTVKLAELSESKVRKEALKAEMERERRKLIAEKSAQQQSIAELKQKESEITKELKEKQARATRLENEIQRIIAAEIRRAKDEAIRSNIVDEANRVGLISGKDYTNNTSNDALKKLIEKKKEELRAANRAVAEAPAKPSYELTPEATRLAANFSANRSLLPWPVERGIVVTNFGPQRHPVAKSVIINNNGIDIATERGSVAKASFNGEVTSRFRIPGEGYVVMLKHGNYFTVYKNLSDIYVVKGQQVTAGQELGLILTNESNGKTVLHFELWQETQVMDPLPWLAKK